MPFRWRFLTARLMPNTKPLVAAALVCERVLTESDSVISAIRMVDRYTITEMQVPSGIVAEGQPMPIIDLTTLVILKSGDLVGPSEASIVLRTPDQKTVVFPQKWQLDFKGGEAGGSLITRFAMPATAPAGLYWFDVIWEGETLTSIPLRLVREPKAQETAPGATN